MKDQWNAARLWIANLRGTPSAAPLTPAPMEIGTEAPIRTKGEDRLRRVGYRHTAFTLGAPVAQGKEIFPLMLL